MKKNFVKKSLATTLALAMVATAMPAAFTTASAAKAPALNRTSKTLYINENAVGNKYDFNISNKVSGSKYSWTTSNKAIAKVNSKGLTTPGTKTGEATISCKITLPTKKTKTLKATVTVKENATKVWAKNAPENNTVGIGENVFDFDSSFSTASGAKATDYRMWEIDEASNTAGAKIDRKNGKVTTTKAGEFKVRVRAYQNKEKLAANDTVDSEWMTIKVVSSIDSVKQSHISKVAVTFDDNMKDKVKISDFAIQNKTNNVVSSIKDIDFSEDGKVVTLETYNSFVDGGTYVLTYAGATNEFATSIGNVETIEITTSKVNTNEETVIKYVLKNANGVDITDAKQDTVTIEAVENNNGYLVDGKLTIFTKGSTAKVKATYHTYNWDEKGNEIGVKTAEATIVAVDKVAASVGNYKNYVIADQEPDWTKVTVNSNIICVGDENKVLYVNAEDSEKNRVTGLTFKSGNDNVLLVNSVNDSAELIAVNEGATVVNVYKGDTFLWSLPVVVKAERKASSVVLSSTNMTVSNGFNGETEVKVTVKDQYNEVVENAKFAEVTAMNQAAKNLGNKANNLIKVADSKVVVNANDITKGIYQFSVSLKDNAKVQAVITINVVDKAGDETSSIGFATTTEKVDTTITKSTEIKDNMLSVSNKLFEKDKNGVVSGSAINATVKVTKPDGTVVSVGTTSDDTHKPHFTFDNGVLTFNYLVANSSSIEKAATGTYRIDASVEVSANNVKRTVAYINVEDNQVAPTVTVKSLNATSFDEIIKNITVNRDKCTVQPLTEKQYVSNGSKSYHVKEVTITEQIGEFVISHTVKVGKTFTTTN
nr:hypothetical protein [uncultured Anaerosporobacter sp.]